jgi:hypothetical protein
MNNNHTQLVRMTLSTSLMVCVQEHASDCTLRQLHRAQTKPVQVEGHVAIGKPIGNAVPPPRIDVPLSTFNDWCQPRLLHGVISTVGLIIVIIAITISSIFVTTTTAAAAAAAITTDAAVNVAHVSLRSACLDCRSALLRSKRVALRIPVVAVGKKRDNAVSTASTALCKARDLSAAIF